jgi:hypothetical protein
MFDFIIESLAEAMVYLSIIGACYLYARVKS